MRVTTRIGAIEANEETLYELSWILRHSTIEFSVKSTREAREIGEQLDKAVTYQERGKAE